MFPTATMSDGTNRSTFRDRDQATSVLDVELSGEAVLITPGFVLGQVASVVYQKFDEWYRIAEISNVRYPMDWAIGDKIKVDKEAVAESKPLIAVKRNY